MAALLCALTLAPDVQAQVCEDADVQSKLQYLRRLSLDLRGRLPDYDELASVVTNGDLDPAIVDAMIESEEFVHQLREHHRDLLWTNVRDQRLAGGQWDLRVFGRGQDVVWAVGNRRIQYRGGPATCLSEPARFDPDTGEILTTPDPQDPRIRREGYVEMSPYWAPDTTIRVCAFDAQTNLQGTNPRGGGTVDCERSFAPECGCGPNLQWCQSRTAGTSDTITGSMNEQLLRYLDEIVRDDRPYTDVVLGTDMPINGPISHWLRLQSQTGGAQLIAAAEQNHPIPELAYTELDRWQTVERGARHAGVLSMPAYLLKFASNRGRANRFYEAFLCQHFESNEPIPPATDPCHQETDLTKRCGCRGCHVAVEPAAAYWGRWVEAGLLAMNDDLFPRFNPTCVDGRGANSTLCRLFYFTNNDVTAPEVEDQYVGMLRAYVFADSEREANIETGPEGLATAAVDSGAFARCTVEKMWKLLLARAPAPDEAETVQQLADDLTTNRYRLKTLIRTLVSRPEYVEAGRHGEED